MALPDAAAAEDPEDEEQEEPERLKYARMGGDIPTSLRGAAIQQNESSQLSLVRPHFVALWYHSNLLLYCSVCEALL